MTLRRSSDFVLVTYSFPPFPSFARNMTRPCGDLVNSGSCCRVVAAPFASRLYDHHAFITLKPRDAIVTAAGYHLTKSYEVCEKLMHCLSRRRRRREEISDRVGSARFREGFFKRARPFPRHIRSCPMRGMTIKIILRDMRQEFAETAFFHRQVRDKCDVNRIALSSFLTTLQTSFLLVTTIIRWNTECTKLK